MDEVLTAGQMKGDQDARISEAIRLEWARLRNFIRKRVLDAGDAEDILQDVFYELIEAYRLTKPVEQVGAWLFRVARNRITDRFRKKGEAEDHAAESARDGRICCRRTEAGRMRLTREACCWRSWRRPSKSFPRNSARYSWRTSWRGEVSRRFPRRRV